MKLKYSTLAKGVFAILAFLVVTGVTLYGIGRLQDARLAEHYSEGFQQRVRVLRILDFLGWYVGAAGAPARELRLGRAGAEVLAEPERFFEQLVAVRNSLHEFIRSPHRTCDFLFLSGTSSDDRSATRARLYKASTEVLRYLGYAETDMRQGGWHKRSGGELPLRQINDALAMSDAAIRSIQRAHRESAREPAEWACLEINSLHNATVTNERLRKNSDGNYVAFIEALGMDAFGRRIGAMKPKEFEVFADLQRTEHDELVAALRGDTSVRIAQWLPPLDWRWLLRAYPWAVASGIAIMLLLALRFRRAAREPDADVDVEDPGFPAGLAFPPVGRPAEAWADRATIRVERALAACLLAVPLALATVLVYGQAARAQSLAAFAADMERRQEHDVGRMLAKNIAALAPRLAPAPMQLAGLAAAFIALLTLVLELAKLHRELAARAGGAAPPAGPGPPTPR